MVGYNEWPQPPDAPEYDGPECAIEAVHLTAGSVGQLCAPILIPWPGVPIDAAARTCGVNRTTIHRWAKAGRIVMDIYPKRNGTDLHRADKMVWTRTKLDPGGVVWSPPWGMEMDDAEEISRRFQSDWSQTLHRSHRCLGKKSICMFWRCPKCEKWVYKLYLTLPLWTLPDAMGISLSGSAGAFGGGGALRFACRGCAKLLYESTERTSRPAKGRTVDHWDRFIRRLTAGTLRGKDVENPDATRLKTQDSSPKTHNRSLKIRKLNKSQHNYLPRPQMLAAFIERPSSPERDRGSNRRVLRPRHVQRDLHEPVD